MMSTLWYFCINLFLEGHWSTCWKHQVWIIATHFFMDYWMPWYTNSTVYGISPLTFFLNIRKWLVNYVQEQVNIWYILSTKLVISWFGSVCPTLAQRIKCHWRNVVLQYSANGRYNVRPKLCNMSHEKYYHHVTNLHNHLE